MLTILVVMLHAAKEFLCCIYKNLIHVTYCSVSGGHTKPVSIGAIAEEETAPGRADQEGTDGRHQGGHSYTQGTYTCNTSLTCSSDMALHMHVTVMYVMEYVVYHSEGPLFNCMPFRYLNHTESIVVLTITQCINLNLI